MPNGDTPHITNNHSTIFKTWLTDLTKIQGVVNNIKSIELWANGATGLLNPNVVNNLSSAINGLNLQQAQLALSTRNLTQKQMNQVLVQAGLIASEDRIQAELLQSALAQAGLSAEKQKAILKELELIDVTTGEIITTKACTKEELLNALAVKSVTGANTEAIISILGLADVNGIATISFELLTASIWANIKALVKWLATNPVGWCVLAAAAIFGAVKAFDALTVSFDEAVEKTKSSKQELDQLTSEISDLNGELETTKDRIDELLEKANSGTISLLEEDELNNLKEQNNELQREIDLKEKLAEIDAKEAADNAANSLTYKIDDDHWDQEYNATDRIDKLQKYVDTASYYQEKMSEVNQQILDIEESATDNSYKNDSVYRSLIKQQEKYQDELRKTEGLMSSTYKELTDEDDGLYYNGKVVDGYEELIERLSTAYTAVELYFNEGNIEDTTEKYVETIKNKLIDSGLSEEISNTVAKGFSEEELSSIMNSDSIDWSQCLRLDDATAVIENIKGQLASVGNADETPISLSTALTTSEESLDKFQSSVKSAADAYTTLLTGNYSSSELLDSIQAINKAASDMGESIDWESISASGNPLQSIQDAIESVSKSYADSVLSGAGIDTDSRFGQMLANIVQESYKSEAALDSLNTQIDSLQSAYNNLTDIVSAYNETGYITFDQLQTLLAMEPQYLSCLIDENGQLQLNQESMMALANQRLDDAEAQVIQQAITELGELAYRKEQAAIEDVDVALINNAETLTTYEGKLLETAQIANLTTSEFVKLSNAINGAMNEGASQEQTNAVIDNMNKKLQLIGITRNNLSKSLGNIVGGSGGSGSSSAKSDFSETIDFFERRVKILDNALSHLDSTLDNVAGSFGKNNLIDAELGITEEKFNNYTDALSMYTQKANEAFSKIPADIASKVKDGAVALTDFIGDGNKDVVEAIKEYESWADKIEDCQQELSELQKEIRQLELDKFNNIMDDFKNQFDLRGDSKDLISKQIDLLKEAGELIGKSFYTAQIDQSKKQLELLENEKAQLVNQMSSAISSGRVNCCPLLQ